MNIVEFLIEKECRVEEQEGFDICALQYHDHQFFVRHDKPDRNSIASFYLPKDCEISFDNISISDVSKECFIQESIYSEIRIICDEFVEDFINLLSLQCNCSSDCTMESGCLLLQQLSVLNCRLKWRQDWIAVVTDLAEKRIWNWIYNL